MSVETLQIRIHGDAAKPALIYLPGIHGDWTLVSSFRHRMRPHFRFVEFTYPRTLEWSLDDYAVAVLAALAQQEIREGILLGESFGSQVAWALLARRPPAATPPRDDRDCAPSFQALALILAGGFVRYPFMPLVDFAHRVWQGTPAPVVRAFFKGYAIVARWRHRHAPETAAAIKEFVARRTAADLAAIGHRLRLIRGNDPVGVAREIALPVLQLTGFWDPIVWHPAVRRWLRVNCPGYRATRVIARADHNVLGTAPDAAAAHVLAWRWATEDVTLSGPPSGRAG
jgi:pimeloyl-ACP methyl ester carboxylesterase